MRALLLGGVAALVAGCAVTDQLARDRARLVVDAAVARSMPGVDISPVTDCVIDNATTDEILQMAGSSAAGAQTDAIEQALGILRRPETTACIGRSALTRF